jgi:ATP synthase protein I
LWLCWPDFSVILQQRILLWQVAFVVGSECVFCVAALCRHQKMDGASPMTFFIGEFIKIAMTMALMGAVVILVSRVNWAAFLIAFILVLKSYFILLFRQRP